MYILLHIQLTSSSSSVEPEKPDIAVEDDLLNIEQICLHIRISGNFFLAEEEIQTRELKVHKGFLSFKHKGKPPKNSSLNGRAIKRGGG